MFFGYPGGKTKLLEPILERLVADPGCEYREPFFGAGSLLLALSARPDIKNIWINDKDLGIACLWTAVICFPELLKPHVKNFVPSVERFYEYKEFLLKKPPRFEDMSDEEIAEYGFKKLALHQMSFSGTGTKAGGPRGGRFQTGQHNQLVDCRWFPDYICDGIDAAHTAFSKLKIREGRCTNYDFEVLLHDDAMPAKLYLDPPYYEQGKTLYQHSFSRRDHIRLCAVLADTKHRWLLSYDNCSYIRDLYGWASVDKLSAVYTVGKVKTGNNELLIQEAR